ncbi:hypothetical protein EV688_12123 [Chromatocurvus halotolerans]|uniref:Uncharacterized protein n=1 Tax=Chromatocurvus halotolerans TaxID=1132028 RepID=A0A4R2KH83_9GAMM|nr:hypothetical protein EV688_12123 [Chromatocurvus halotolerans]
MAPAPPVSVADINRVPVPLAYNIIPQWEVLLCRSDFRLRAEQQRVWSLWAEYKAEHERHRKALCGIDQRGICCRRTRVFSRKIRLSSATVVVSPCSEATWTDSSVSASCCNSPSTVSSAFSSV